VTYFLSFIREFGSNPDYSECAFGRVEVSRPGDKYPSEEIRFCTSRINEFERFSDRWDFQDVTAGELALVRKTIAERFVEFPGGKDD
jgi:hypothetical protein